MAMMQRNIFLDIINGTIPATIVHQDEHCVAFRDIHPQAPTHVLIIPREEIRTHADLTASHVELMGRLHAAAAVVAKNEGLTGYRLIINCGEEAGQTVPHLHMHLMGGRALAWPPG